MVVPLFEPSVVVEMEPRLPLDEGPATYRPCALRRDPAPAARASPSKPLKRTLVSRMPEAVSDATTTGAEVLYAPPATVS